MTDEIQHHGVLGQKWGVRNGPPYPLMASGKQLFKSEKVTASTIKQYSSQYRQLNHVRVNSNTSGEILTRNGQAIGMVNTEKKQDGNTWIQGIEVFGNNKGKGLGTQLLDKAVNDYGATHLSVNKGNKIAKAMYDKYGFKTYKSDSVMNYMRLDTKSAINKIYNSLSKNEQSKLTGGKPYALASDSVYHKVHYVKGQPASFVELYRDSGYTKSEVSINVATDPNYRGQGLSKSMVKDILANPPNGIKTIYWETDKNNKASGALARSLGFGPSTNFNNDDDNYVYHIQNKKGGSSMDLKHNAKQALLQSVDSISDHLEHHGVLGQKWGVRNGPPYPLNSSNGRLTPEGLAKSILTRDAYELNILDYYELPQLNVYSRLSNVDKYNFFYSIHASRAYDNRINKAEKAEDEAPRFKVKDEFKKYTTADAQRKAQEEIMKYVYSNKRIVDVDKEIHEEAHRKAMASLKKNEALSREDPDLLVWDTDYAVDNDLKHSAKLVFIQSADRVTDHLEHHGIIGQRWGRRNGPPYPLNATGKEKFKEGLKMAKASVSKGAAAVAKKTVRTTSRVAKAGASTLKRRNEERLKAKRAKDLEKAMKSDNKKKVSKAISKMSDKELQTVLNRMRLENQYRDEYRKTPQGQREASSRAFRQQLGKAATDVAMRMATEKLKQAVGLKNEYDERADKKADLELKKEKNELKRKEISEANPKNQKSLSEKATNFLDAREKRLSKREDRLAKRDKRLRKQDKYERSKKKS